MGVARAARVGRGVLADRAAIVAGARVARAAVVRVARVVIGAVDRVVPADRVASSASARMASPCRGRPVRLGRTVVPVRRSPLGSARTGNDIVHMGLYLGAGQFVHAAGPGDVVRLASMYDPVWATSYLGARRI